MSGLSYIKKILCACLCVVAVACNKSSTAPNENDKPDKTANTSAAIRKYAVRFSLGDIDVSDGRTANREMPVRNYLHCFSYLAYDSTGRQVSKIVQDSVTTMAGYLGPEFGNIKDSLPAGDYTIVVIGGQYNSFTLEDDSLLSTFQLFNRYGDVCLKKFDISVSEHDSAAKSIKLERITGSLEIKLKDSLHPEVRLENVYVDSTCLHMQIATGELRAAITDMFPTWVTLTNPFSLSNNYLGSNTSHTVTIVGCDINAQPLVQKVVTGVYIYANRKTILTGKLFDTTDSTGRIAKTVSVDKYSGTITQEF